MTILAFTEISINTPALLFPAITLLMLAYTNRFLALATLIRNLHSKYRQVHEKQDTIRDQIANLRTRLNLVKRMQAYGIVSFFCCVLCMLAIYLEYNAIAFAVFGLSLIFLLVSLILSFREILISTKALEIELRDMENE